MKQDFFCRVSIVSRHFLIFFSLQILRELYARIKQIKQSRSALLGAIYGLVECNSSKVLLLIAQIVLGMGVGGNQVEIK